LAAIFAVLVMAACDDSHPHDQSFRGALVFVTGINVGSDRPMPEDGVIAIGVERYLLPSTVTRQSFALADAYNQSVGAELLPAVTYDPVARMVTLARPFAGQPWLTKGLTYKLFLGIPQDDSSLGGVRAIDGATLSPNQVLEFAFRVGEPNGVGSGEPTIDLCRDVMPIFATKCSSSLCHGMGNSAAAGLVLATPAGIANTALSRVAHGANTGAVGVAQSAGAMFGVDMPVIDPGNPGNSWLMYKVALAAIPEHPLARPSNACNAQATSPTPFVPLVPVSQASDADRAVLANAVLGTAMPPVPIATSYAEQALTFDEQEILRLWIARLTPGAAMGDCSACGE
jgi:hypothetical protein